ncbi:MAG TPA: hypothetical protein P5136_00725 [Methanofastidiosum sp.]|nr:hypothetical protein [Methanofastidiosum sp.]
MKRPEIKQIKKIVGRLVHRPQKEMKDKTVYTRKVKHKKQMPQ